jgi:Flp pilus assembly protein TadB
VPALIAAEPRDGDDTAGSRTSRFAIGIKAVFFVLALAGIATLWMAVFADMGASLIVAANGLRLLRWRPAARRAVNRR